MLRLLLGTDWIANRDAALSRIARDVSDRQAGRILLVPELISHEMERRLCLAAGDTASRYAEVLSFTRLARRVAEWMGVAPENCMDAGGRVVAMAAAARQLHSRLKAYASVETRPEFLTGLVEAVDEFKRCRIQPEDLRRASQALEGSFAQKLEELALLLETYDTLCARGSRDPRDQMNWLLSQLEAGDFAQRHVFYIDGFPDFTRQHMAILEHLIETSPLVTVSLNCDRPGSNAMAFEKAGQTAMELLRCAQEAGTPVEITTVPPRSVPLSPLHAALFQGALPKLPGQVHAFAAGSPMEECQAVAERILDLVAAGCRYRDISVACGDLPGYRQLLRLVFRRRGIPIYISGTEDILGRTVISAVLTALDAALGGFERRDVLRYIKSMVSPLTPEEADRVENYALLWNIQGSRWLRPWERHPEGLGGEWNDTARETLLALNEARDRALAPLEGLWRGFRQSGNLAGQVEALYRFLTQLSLADRLDRMAEELDSAGDNRGAQILNQLWEILLNALEQLYDVLGQTHWEPESFVRLLTLLLSQYDVGTIPPVLDAVTVGPVSALRCQQCRHLFVLAAEEGNLPRYSGSRGVLTDRERVTLRSLGVPLTGGALEGLQAEFAEIYGVFAGASQTVTVSCSAQPSFLYSRLEKMAGGPEPVGMLLGAARTDRLEAGAFLARLGGEEAADTLGLTDVFRQVRDQAGQSLGALSPETVAALYGGALRLSASQIDRQADCRLAYFLQYGIRAQERKPAAIDPAEFGTYIHAVLEKTCRQVMAQGGFHNTGLEETLSIARFHSAAYAQERFGQLDARAAYLFQRNARELEMVVEEVWRELRDAQFAPAYFELPFGDRGRPPVNASGEKMDAILRGVVDRVDVWRQGENTYFRVVDYKTGKKDMDYCDLYHGLGLQMLLYLFALADTGGDLLGRFPIPAGVEYFPARAPVLPADSRLGEEAAEKERQKQWRRRGLLLGEEPVIRAMEPGDSPVRLCCKRGKDGALSGDLADREQLALLKRYVFRLVGRMADEIAAGRVAPNPYARGSAHDACAYCPYGAVCRGTGQRRNGRKMEAQEFWAALEKEDRHG